MTSAARRARAGSRLAPGALVIPPALRQEPDAPAPTFGDQKWCLDALGRGEGHRTCVVTWLSPDDDVTHKHKTRPWPSALLRDGAKADAWGLVNIPDPGEPEADVDGAGPAAGSVATTVSHWRGFARWLAETTGAETFADADETVLERYRQHVLTDGGSVQKPRLRAVERLWEYGPHLPAHARLPEPPWLSDGPDANRVASRKDGQNRTEPLHPATMSPLLVWALRFVQDFAPDILAAWKEHQRLYEPAPEDDRDSDADQATLSGYIARLRSEGRPYPGGAYPSGVLRANRYVAGLLGLPERVVQARVRDHDDGLPVGTTTPLASPVRALLHDEPWTGTFQFAELPGLVCHLVTACQVVTSYLSGLRVDELLALRTGCCPEPEGPDPRYRLRGKYFKHATDNGKAVRAGLPRDWVVIPPVRDAVRVMEALHGEGDFLLFPARSEWQRMGKEGARSDLAMTTNSLTNGIQRLIGWVNAHAAERGLVGETIPPDSRGKVTGRRFRRTVAWFVFRRPRGRVALGVQYGHLDLAVTDGYGNRLRELDNVFKVERALLLVDSLTGAAEAADRGEHVSGSPAAVAQHAKAAAVFKADFRGTHMTDARLVKLATNPALQVVHDDGLLLSCNPRRGAMACQQGRPPTVEETPSAVDCKPFSCSCATRSDTDVLGMRDTVAALLASADSGLLARPLADRQRRQAALLLNAVERHEASRPTAVPA